jgi:queuine tRNA-ribosyltransferase catalytic subunit
MNLRHSSYAQDFSPIEESCSCVCCKPTEEGGLGITRAYIYHVAAKETAGAHLYVFFPETPGYHLTDRAVFRLSIHNVHYLLSLMKSARAAIIEDRYPAFLKEFFGKLYEKKEDYPEWAVNALNGVDVDLLAE